MSNDSIKGRAVSPATGVALVALALLGGFLYVWLQGTQEFSYFYREQQQVFLYDSTYLNMLVSQIGGVGVLISQYLTQFFLLTKGGALITSLISVAIGIFLWLAFKRVSHSWFLAPLLMLPAFFYNLYLADSYVHYEGLIALLFMALFLWLHSCLVRTHWGVRATLSTLGSFCLYIAFGPVAVLYALTLVLYDRLMNVAKLWLSLIPLALVLMTGLMAVNQGVLVNLSTAYWMQGYIEYFFNPGMFYNYAWLSVPVVLLLFRIFDDAPRWFQTCSLLLGLVILPFGYTQINESHQDKSMYKVEQIAYYANHENWDNVVRVAQSETGNYIFLNYLNLALSKKGLLLDRFLTIPQAGSQSLILSNSQNADVSMLMALLYYHTGVVGLSQVHAYSSNMAVNYGSPEMNKLMIKNYLINGQYKVAEKHIKMLEKTKYYAAWAKNMRQFVNNDQTLEADPELGAKRKDLPDNDAFTVLYGPINDLLTILDANPSENTAAEYAIAMLLLDKNFDGIRVFVERYFGKLSIWPVCLQEAIVAGSEKDMDYCREHGVSEEVIQRFAQFRNETLQLRHGGGSVQQLARNWGNSYWYYMLKTGQK